MATDLTEAYNCVFKSSKQILKNKQRHLYVNMLELLTRTIKASNASSISRDLITDEYIKLVCIEILPLLFDTDKNIQDNAIITIEVFLSNLDTKKFHNIPEWPAIKAQIVDSYSEQLRSLRETNSNWYKIWCQLIRILDKEILKASVINPFLSIVESGFRSDNYQTRSEAFICWKCLIKIFSDNNEISSAKRIKLICIPLKSSQARTIDTAINKFKVWWYFLCKLGTKKIEDYLNVTLESFLTFCFGTTINQLQYLHQHYQKHTNNVKSYYYPVVKQMAIACFIEMLIDNENNINASLALTYREVRHILETKGLEVPVSSSSLISLNILHKIPKLIINAGFDSTVMILENGLGTEKFFKILWKLLYDKILKLNNYDIYIELYRQLKEFLNCQYVNDKTKMQCFNHIIDLMIFHNEFPIKFEKTIKKEEEGEKNELNKNENENSIEYHIFDNIWNFIELLIENIQYLQLYEEFDEIFKNLLNLKKCKHLNDDELWLLQNDFIEIIMKNDLIVSNMMMDVADNDHHDDNQKTVQNQNNHNTNNKNIKCILNLILWKCLTLNIIDYLNKFSNMFGFRQNSKNLNILNEWILWPLNQLSLYDDTEKPLIPTLFNNENDNHLIDEFLKVWKNLTTLHSNKISSNVIKNVSIHLKLLLNNEKSIKKFSDIICEFISCLDSKFDSSSKPTEFLDLIKSIITNKKFDLKDKIKIIVSFNSYIKSLGNDQIYDLFPELKVVISIILRLHLIQNNDSTDDKTKSITLLKRNENELQRLLLDKLKSNKKLLKEFKEITSNRNDKNTDEFVIIPTVWSLNPDKLTEHQKEKMKEKRVDIPALYNELSQSQDANSNTNSIKPWTPNKIVIAKSKDSTSEIIISSTVNSENLIDKQNEKSHSKVLNESEIRNCEGNQIEIKNSRTISPSRTLRKQQQNKSLSTNSSNNDTVNNRNESILTEQRTELNSESVLKTQRSPIKHKQNKSSSPTTAATATTSTSTAISTTNTKESRRRLSVCKDTENQMNENSKDDVNENERKNKNDDEDILNKFNIQIEDKEKRQKIIKQLKTIKIDTAEGFTVVQQKLRRRPSIGVASVLTSTSDNNSGDDGDEGDGAGGKRKKRAKLSKDSSDISDTSTATASDTIETTTTNKNLKSSSKPARKSLQFENLNEKQNNNDDNQDKIENDISNLNNGSTKESSTKNNEKEKTDKDSSNEEAIGSSQQCESVFAKRFMLRKSMTPTMNGTNRVSSPNKIKSNHKKETIVENPTVPDDLNGAHIPTKTASESRETKTVEATTTAEIVPLPSSSSSSSITNQKETENFNNRESMTLLLNTQQNELSPTSSSSNTKVNNDKNDANRISEMDTEPFNLSLIKHLPNNNTNSSTIIKSPLREVHTAFTLNNPQQSSKNSTNTINTMTTENKLCEAETQPNTENFDSSKENSPITPNKHHSNQQQDMMIVSESPNLSPMFCEKSACLPKSGVQLNKSILSSPEFVNAEEKANEFLNDTLNISPISIEVNRPNHESDENRKNPLSGVTTITTNTTTNTNSISNTNDIMKCTSPTSRKSTSKSTMNLSPPDRKPINTVCSPAIKPKPMSQLMGRGAQFINMIRNKNTESTSKQLVNTLMSSSTTTTTAGKNSTDDKSSNNVILEQQNSTEQELNLQNEPKSMKINDNATNVTTTNCPPFSTSNVLMTPINHKDLLIFSKTLPSPNASPSASILKRKLCKDSLDETVETPITKRKRVSFHDPPVSVTKEYVKHSEENHRSPLPLIPTSTFSPLSIEKPHFTRCLLPENTSTPQNMKKFKRISRADSMKGIAKFVKQSPKAKRQHNDQQPSTSSSTALSGVTMMTNEIEDNQKKTSTQPVALLKNHPNGNSNVVAENSIEMESLKWESVDHNSIKKASTTVITEADSFNIMNDVGTKDVNDRNSENSNIAVTDNGNVVTEPATVAAIAVTDDNNDNVNDDDDDDENSLTPSPSLYFPDDQSVFNYLFEKYTFDTIIEKYLNSNKKLNLKSSKYIIKEISEQMLTDNKLKSNIMELLSEKHPIEFLEHAIQENLSSTVCDKLNSNSIIEYICEKSKLNSSIRKLLLDRVEDLLNFDKLHIDLYNFIIKILNKNKLSNDEILNCIKIMVNHKNDQNNGNDNNNDDGDVNMRNSIAEANK